MAALTSCSGVRSLEIETYAPSDVTFPKGVRKVLVVDNALPQPSDVGCRFKYMNVEQDTCHIATDSAIYEACRSLGKELADADYFDDVLLYSLPTRSKSESFFTDGKLTPEEVSELCRTTGTDAVVSIDRLLFDVKRDISGAEGGYYTGDIRVNITGMARSYLPQQQQATTVLVNDSLFISGWSYSPEEANVALPSCTKAADMAGDYIGRKLYVAFVPHWEKAQRMYYTGVSTTWQLAGAAAAAKKWDEAASYWKNIYDRTSAWKTKAKTAANLALAYEMEGHFQEALDKAKEAARLFRQHAGEADNNTKFLQAYVRDLDIRLANQPLLQKQTQSHPQE
jgi:tetratricopeptide (TPR) repeat protein